MHFLCLLSYSVLRGQARLGETADGALHIPLAGPMHDARRACSVLVEETKTQKCPLHWKQWAPYPSPHRAFLWGCANSAPPLESVLERRFCLCMVHSKLLENSLGWTRFSGWEKQNDSLYKFHAMSHRKHPHAMVLACVPCFCGIEFPLN